MVKSLKQIFANTKKIIFIAFLLSVTLTLLIKGFENPKIDDVYADTNLPLNYNFAPPTVVSSVNSNDRTYKDLDFTATVKNFDKRVYVLDQYFLKNHSPLYGNAKFFAEACTKYNAPKDCTTVAAIAMNETHLCKYANSAEMFNCWGYGGPGIYRVTFKNFQDGIFRVTDVLANQYGVKYMIDPTLMELTFCGKEDNCVGWGNRIKSFMRQINDLSVNLGMGDLFSLR